MFNLKKGELEMKELSIKVVVSEEKYNEMIENLKIVFGLLKWMPLRGSHN